MVLRTQCQRRSIRSDDAGRRFRELRIFSRCGEGMPIRCADIHLTVGRSGSQAANKGGGVALEGVST